ncbi:MAG: hypothetical protein AVDCRST_MAG69-846, partial [uncultured Solirubrobacteraceae bacterium]
ARLDDRSCPHRLPRRAFAAPARGGRPCACRGELQRRSQRAEARDVAGPAVRGAGSAPGPPDRGLRPRPEGRLLPLRRVDGRRRRARHGRPRRVQPRDGLQHPPAVGRAVPPGGPRHPRALPAGQDDVGVERGEPLHAADPPQPEAGGRLLQRAARGVPRVPHRRRRRPRPEGHGEVAGHLQAPRPGAEAVGPAQLRRRQPLQAPAAHRHRQAPEARQGRGVADRGGRHRPLRLLLQGRPRGRGAGGARHEADLRAGAHEHAHQTRLPLPLGCREEVHHVGFRSRRRVGSRAPGSRGGSRRDQPATPGPGPPADRPPAGRSSAAAAAVAL